MRSKLALLLVVFVLAACGGKPEAIKPGTKTVPNGAYVPLGQEVVVRRPGGELVSLKAVEKSPTEVSLDIQEMSRSYKLLSSNPGWSSEFYRESLTLQAAGWRFDANFSAEVWDVNQTGPMRFMVRLIYSPGTDEAPLYGATTNGQVFVKDAAGKLVECK